MRVPSVDLRSTPPFRDVGRFLGGGVRLAAVVALLAVVLAARASAAPAIADYGNLPAIDLMRLSPSGERIAFVAVTGDDRSLFVRKVGGDALLVRKLGESQVRQIQWAGDDFVIVLATTTVKFGNREVDKWSYSTRALVEIAFIVDLKTDTVRQIFDSKGNTMFLGLVSGFWGARQIDGHWCGFFGAVATTGGENDLYRVDLETGAAKRLTDAANRSGAYVIGGDGRILARAYYDNDSRQFRLLAGDKGGRIVLRRDSPLDLIGLSGMGRTPGTVLITDDATDGDGVEYAIAATTSPTPLLPNQSVESWIHDPLTDLVIGANVKSDQGSVFFDPASERRYLALRRAFPGLMVTLASFSAGLDRMIAFTDGGQDPGTYWLVDMASGKAAELTAAYPQVPPQDVGPTRMFAYRASDGLPLDAVLTLPPGSSGRNLPLVVIPHGGPIGIRDKIGFDYWAQAFASRGYAVLQSNYRGSGGHGTQFRDAGAGQWGKRMLTDIGEGAIALEKAGVADPKRVCIVGASYGGYAALAGVTLQHGLYRCAVSIAGVSDVGAVVLREGGTVGTAAARYDESLFGAYFPSDPKITNISPLRFAADASAPILLIHGKNDTVVPFVHSQAMYDALRAAGKPVELEALEGEDHWLSQAKTRVRTLEAAVAFVERNNPPS
ncbi:MAG TPA: prolyl oligopeptidase family serine peptidase [Caulobacteraceae bacterium]